MLNLGLLDGLLVLLSCYEVVGIMFDAPDAVLLLHSVLVEAVRNDWLRCLFEDEEGEGEGEGAPTLSSSLSLFVIQTPPPMLLLFQLSL